MSSTVINQNCKNDFANALFNVALNSSIGAAGGWAFRLIHPMGGAVLGATTAVVTAIVTPLLTKALNLNSEEGKIFFWAINFFARVGLCMLAAAAFGFAITFQACLLFNLAMIPIECLVSHLIHCILKSQHH